MWNKVETQKGVEGMGEKIDNFKIQIKKRSELLNLLEKNSLQEWIDFVFSQKRNAYTKYHVKGR